MTRYAGPGHRPGKTGHRVLRALANDRLDLAQLMFAADVDPSNAKGRKFTRLLSALVRDELIVHGRTAWTPGQAYAITDAGRDALARLDAGETIDGPGAPSVRIFARAAA